VRVRVGVLAVTVVVVLALPDQAVTAGGVLFRESGTEFVKDLSGLEDLQRGCGNNIGRVYFCRRGCGGKGDCG
jgi:hypothetical protein